VSGFAQALGEEREKLGEGKVQKPLDKYVGDLLKRNQS
jgi:hypothetical protein